MLILMVREIESTIAAARYAQTRWADRVPRDRLRAIGRIAGQIAMHQDELLERNPRPAAGAAEILASELLPLADACSYTAKQGRRLLSPKTHPMRQGAWWMGRIGVTVTREPWGVVLVLACSNYPLFLPGVQTIQALAAGNAVILKPAPGCRPLLQRFQQCVVTAGVPQDLIQVVPDTMEAGQAAIDCGVDKVVLTGSADTGRSLLTQLAGSLTPATLELGGCDAVFVTPKADLERVARCLAFGLRLNAGATCIAPRRVFVTQPNRQPLCDLLLRELARLPTASYAVAGNSARRIAAAANEALSGGARILHGEVPQEDASQMQLLVLQAVSPQMQVARQDLFGPVTSLIEVSDMSQALVFDRECPYSLAASVFGPYNHAQHWAEQIQAGCVVINDVIVPTADPRVPFGGRDQSGWGVTRGPDGLLEMTRPKALCTRYGNWLPHLHPKNSANPQLLSAMLSLLHARSWKTRLAALRKFLTHLN